MQLSSFSLQTALFFSRGTLESKKFRKSRGKAKCPSSFSPHRVASTSPPPSPISICKYSLFTFCIQNTLYTKRKKTREGRGKRSCFAGGGEGVEGARHPPLFASRSSLFFITQPASFAGWRPLRYISFSEYII